MLTLTRCTKRRMRNVRCLSKRRQRFTWDDSERWLAERPQSIDLLKLSDFLFQCFMFVFFCLLLCDLFQSIVGFFCCVSWLNYKKLFSTLCRVSIFTSSSVFAQHSPKTGRRDGCCVSLSLSLSVCLCECVSLFSSWSSEARARTVRLKLRISTGQVTVR